MLHKRVTTEASSNSETKIWHFSGPPNAPAQQVLSES